MLWPTSNGDRGKCFPVLAPDLSPGKFSDSWGPVRANFSDPGLGRCQGSCDPPAGSPPPRGSEEGKLAESSGRNNDRGSGSERGRKTWPANPEKANQVGGTAAETEENTTPTRPGSSGRYPIFVGFDIRLQDWSISRRWQQGVRDFPSSRRRRFGPIQVARLSRAIGGNGRTPYVHLSHNQVAYLRART